MSLPSSSDVKALAKAGNFQELQQRWNDGERFDLAVVFDRAVTDYRTVKRVPGHLEILKFCVEQGMPLDVRPDWLGQTAFCSAARYGNNEFVAFVAAKCGVPDSLFARAAVGDDGLMGSLREATDLSGLNLLHFVAGSGLGRRDEDTKHRLTKLCDWLVEQKVSTTLAVQDEVSITPTLLCAWYGGNPEIMNRLISAGEINVGSLHQAVEFALEPHQRSGPAFHEVAEVIL